MDVDLMPVVRFESVVNVGGVVCFARTNSWSDTQSNSGFHRHDGSLLCDLELRARNDVLCRVGKEIQWGLLMDSQQPPCASSITYSTSISRNSATLGPRADKGYLSFSCHDRDER